MFWFTNRPNPEADEVAAYWDELVRRQPAVPVPPAGLSPSQSAVIRQLHAEEALGSRPDYQDQLLLRLLATYEKETPMSTQQATLPLSSPEPSRTLSPRRMTFPRPAGVAPGRPARNLVPAVHFAIAILLVLASVAGTWWVMNRQDDPQPMMAPAVMQSPADTTTGADYSDHPIVGAWESPNGLPCWCLNVYTADGVAIGLDPNPADSSGGGSSSSMAMGIWQPTGDRTAMQIVRAPAEQGGYLERFINWEVSEDGQTMTGSGTQRVIRPDGTTEELGSSPPMDAVRMTMPDATSDGAPVATPDN